MANSPMSTPKRKYSQLLDDAVPNLNTATQFTFDARSPEQDGSCSPRSRVAQRFQGLALEGGGGVSASGTGQASLSPEPKSIRNAFVFSMQDGAIDGVRKRMKLPDLEMVDVPTFGPPPPVSNRGNAAPSGPRLDDASTTSMQVPQLNAKPTNSNSQPQKSPRSVRFAPNTTIVGKQDADFTQSNATKPDESKPRSRPRAGTPPLMLKAASLETKALGNNSYISDPLRASLTWHDDEITIYDPDDSDDDGTGINGIGFKPTPAIAYARTVKRRQQLAEYRKREEREARAKRNQRRRGSPIPGLVELKGTVERRRVRFMESATELISF